MKDWLQGIILGAVGVPIIALAATGWVPTFIDFILWTVAGITWVVLTQRYAERPWLAILVAGVASAFWAGGMQALLLPRLVANNAAWADYTVDPGTRLAAFGSAFPIGIAWGLLFAGIAWLICYWQTRRRPAMA